MPIFLNGEGNGKPFLGIIPFPDEPPRSEVSNMLLGKSGEMNERRSWAKAEMTLSCLAQARLQPSALHIFQPHASLLEEPRSRILAWVGEGSWWNQICFCCFSSSFRCSPHSHWCPQQQLVSRWFWPLGVSLSPWPCVHTLLTTAASVSEFLNKKIHTDCVFPSLLLFK